MRLIALIFILLSLLNRIEPHHWRVWQASIMTKEFGHWFALLGLFIAFRLWWWRRRVWMTATLVATLLFIGPLWDALSYESMWQDELRLGLQSHATVPPMISFKTLFFGRWEKTIPAERLVFQTKDELGLEFFRSARTEGKSPWVVVVHGGAWDSGDSKQLPELGSHLANLGYAVASIDYRLAPKNKWPAQKEDTLAAIDYLKAHADELGLDKGKYFLLGRSAGGQIALVTAYTANDPALRGVISFYAPTDLFFGYEVGEETDLLGSRPLLRNFLGDTPYDNPKIYADSSPIEASVNSKVPTLLLHGRADTLVWFKHSERLNERLKRRDVKSAYIESWSATHGSDWTLNGPNGQAWTVAVEYFLAEFSK